MLKLFRTPLAILFTLLFSASAWANTNNSDPKTVIESTVNQSIEEL